MARLIRCTVLFFLFFPLAARADYVNLTGAENARNIAEISVEKDHVKVALEIFVQDIGAFLELLPDEFFRESEVTPPPLAVRMEDFSRETFQILTGDGDRLVAHGIVRDADG